MTNLEFLILLLALMSAFIGGYWMKIFKDLKDLFVGFTENDIKNR